MVGKQISFYMLENDEKCFIEYLALEKRVTFLKHYSTKHRVEVLQPPFPSVKDNSQFSRILIVPEDFGVSSDALRRSKQVMWNNQKQDYLPTGEIRYYVDTTIAPILEFDRSWLRADNVLTKGRLYLAVNLIRDHLRPEEEKQLRVWCESIWRWIRRRSLRVEEQSGWFLPEAASSFQNGFIRVMQ